MFAVSGIALSQSVPQTKLYGADEEHTFVNAFNAWALMANQNGMTVDIKEIHAWHATRATWHKLDSIVSQSYK